MRRSRQDRAHCLFCGASSVSREHIIPKSWGPLLAHVYGGRGVSVRFRHVLVSPEGPVDSKSAKRPAYTVRRFCATCNSGFMRTLDEDALAIVQRLILGKPATLSLDHQRLVATWATKTMLVAASGEPPERRRAFGIEPRYAAFFSERRPGADMQVWLGRWQADEPVWSICHNLELRNDMTSEASGFGAVLAMRHMIVMLLATGDPALRIRLDYDAYRAMKLIWPVADTLVWPPRVQVTGTDLRQLIQDVAETATLHNAA